MHAVEGMKKREKGGLGTRLDCGESEKITSVGWHVTFCNFNRLEVPEQPGVGFPLGSGGS